MPERFATDLTRQPSHLRARVGRPCRRIAQDMLRNKIQGLEATDPDFPQLSLVERRRKLRVRTYIRLEIQVSDSQASAIVTDLSLDGLRLRTNYELQEGDRVEVSLVEAPEEGRQGSVFCRCVWSTQFGSPSRPTYEAGLTFQDADENMQRSWVKYVLEQLGFDETKTFQKRKFLRASGEIPARVFTSQDDQAVSGVIVNVGVGGALLSSETPLKVDSLVHCELCLWRILPALRLPCKVLAVNAEDSGQEEEEGSTTYLHSLLFLAMDTEQVKLLGNYVIYLLSQVE